MKSESEPIANDEWLIRLVWHTFFDADSPLPITKSAFEPKRDEVDGISVFRASCLANPEDALAVIEPSKRDLYGIVMIEVAEVDNLGLSVQTAPILTIPGHAVLPELNFASKRANKKLIEVQKELAAIANRRIVRGPKA